MKLLITSFIIAVGLISIALYARNQEAPTNAPIDGANVTIKDGVQYIDLSAKGGYSPRVSVAQAGIATKLKVATSATFDCSASLTIPSIGYRAVLPPSGTTEIDIPAQEAGTVLQGTCSMGMYNFTIQFEKATTTPTAQ
ncbi:MAG: hypothetical protein RLY47_650 [Candidatus Parcubacteria bacterium]|jgi:plastocyanin domain-containing protein